MNNAKMWLVVKPTVGVPLFLAGVAIGSFAVHVAVLTNTSWVDDFLQGKEMGSGDATAALTIEGLEDPSAHVAGLSGLEDGDVLTIVTADGKELKAIVEAPTMVSELLVE